MTNNSNTQYEEAKAAVADMLRAQHLTEFEELFFAQLTHENVCNGVAPSNMDRYILLLTLLCVTEMHAFPQARILLCVDEDYLDDLQAFIPHILKGCGVKYITWGPSNWSISPWGVLSGIQLETVQNVNRYGGLTITPFNKIRLAKNPYGIYPCLYEDLTKVLAPLPGTTGSGFLYNE